MAKRKVELPYVSSVTSNLKSSDGEPWTVELGQRTLIVGRNTSHKSSVIQAVELALTGAADDVVGRNEVKDASLLLSMAPGDSLTSMVNFSADGLAPATFRIERENGKSQRPAHNSPVDAMKVMPHRLVRNALGAGEKTARKAFLAWVSDDVTMEDVLAHMPADLHARYRDVEEKLRRDGSPVDGLLAVVDYAGKQQRDAAKEAKGAESAMSTMGGGIDGERPSDQALQDAQDDVGKAQVDYDNAIRSGGGRPIGDLENAHDQMCAESEQIAGRIREIGEELESLLSTGRLAEDAANALQWALDNNISSCPTCSSDVGEAHLVACRDHWTSRRNAEETRIEGIVESLRDESQVAQSRMAQAQYKIQELQQKMQESLNQGGVVSLMTSEEARERLEKAQSRYSDVVMARTRWDDLSRLRDTVASMQAEAESYKAMKSACEKAVGALLSEQTSRFCKRVDSFLPKSWDFDIELKDGKREVFRMGLKRGDKLHCALSGAEWSAVAVAISMATINESHGPQVLVPEDRAWDPQTLGEVMRSYGKFPGQVIMASTVKPKGRTPAGWTIIDMDEQLAAVIEAPKAEEEPTEPGPGVSIRSARVLKGMGFEPEDIGLMAPGTAADLIRQGLLPHQVTILKSGEYRVVKKDNVLPLSPGR